MRVGAVLLVCATLASLLVSDAGARRNHHRQGVHVRQMTVGWDTGARWGRSIELSEEIYGEDYLGEALPQLVVRVVQEGQNRTVALEFYDDVNDEWVTDDVQRSVRGTALLTPDVWCEDDSGNEGWCDGVWRYRVRSLPEGAMPGTVSRTSRIVFTPYNPCYPWDEWSCGDDGW